MRKMGHKGKRSPERANFPSNRSNHHIRLRNCATSSLALAPSSAFTVPKLFADLALARGDGRYARIMRTLIGVQLLILDDWGLEPLDGGAARSLTRS
jgi:hypothetical protein